MNRSRFPYYLAAAVSLATLLVYLTALRNDFVAWDDNVYVYDNLRIRALNGPFFAWAFTDIATSGFWHPLVWISYALDYALWGLNPAGYHFSSILLHAINTALVVHVVMILVRARRLAGEARRPHAATDDRVALMTAGVTGVLFGLHPLHVESAAWISERKDLLSALFFLSALAAYAGYALSRERSEPAERPRPFSSNRDYLLALLFFVLALASKTMAVTLPAVLLLLDWYPFGRVRSRRDVLRLLIEKLPFVAGSALIAVVSLIGQKATGAFAVAGSIPASSRLLVSFKAFVAYLGYLAMPAGLSPLYPYPANVSWASIEYLSAVALTAAIVAVSILLVRRARIVTAAFAYYGVTILPVIGIVPLGHHFMADRYTYLPSLGPFLLAGAGAAWIWAKTDTLGTTGQHAKRVIIFLGLGLCLAMTAATVRQIAVWKDGVTFWNNVIRREPTRVPFAYESRGNSWKDRGHPDLAVADYTRAIALDTENAGFYNNRGIAYREMGEPERAVEDHTKAIALKPAFADAFNARGVALTEMRQYGRALEDFDQAIALDPGYADAYTSRGWTYREMGQAEQAIKDYTRAIEIEPLAYLAYNDRGMALQEAGDSEGAIRDYSRAVAINPLFAEALVNRGLAYEQNGDGDRALADYTAAIKADPSFGNAYTNRGLLLERTGKLERALADLNRAVYLNPEGFEARINRGLAYEASGMLDAAAHDYTRAIELRPGDPSGYNNRGIVLAKLGRFGEAVRDQSAALALDRRFARAYMDRGESYRLMGKKELAMRDYEAACSLGIREACSPIQDPSGREGRGLR